MAVKSAKCILAIALMGAMAFSPLRGQSLQRYLQNHQFTHIEAIEYSDSSLFVLTLQGSSSSYYSQESILYKLGPSLKTKDSLRITSLLPNLDSNYYFSIQDMAVDSLGSLYLLASIGEPSSDQCPRANKRSAILKVSPDLDHQKTLHLNLPDSSFESFGLALTQNEVFAYGVFDECLQGNLRFAGFIAQTDFPLNSPQLHFYYADSINLPVRPTIRWGLPYDNGQLLNFVYYNQFIEKLNQSMRHSGSCLITDSTKFSGINYTDYRLIKLDSGRFGMFGVTRNDYSYDLFHHYNVGFSQVNPAQCQASIDTFPFLGEVSFNNSPSHVLLNDCFTTRSDDSLLFAVTAKSDPFITSDSAAIYFYNYNFEQMRLNWRKKMENPYFVWPDVALEELPDGRYAVGLSEFNPDRYPQYTRSLAGRLMIIDAEGRALDLPSQDLPVRGNWSLFPNPATHTVKVQGLPPRSQTIRFSLYNTQGQKVHQGHFSTDNPIIPLPLRPGLYYLQLNSDKSWMGSRALRVRETVAR